MAMKIVHMSSKRATGLGVSAMLLASSHLAATAGSSKPRSEIILTISGAISNSIGDDKTAFDLDMLKALPVTTFKTSTTWTEGKNEIYWGFNASASQRCRFHRPCRKSIALNDYGVEIPVSDAVADGPIIASLIDNKPISLRDKGPSGFLTLQRKTEHRTEETYAKSIWQLSRIELK